MLQNVPHRYDVVATGRNPSAIVDITRDSEGLALLFRRISFEDKITAPGGSVRGERANFRGLVLGCIEAKFCKKYALESSRRDLHNALLCTAPKSHFFQ